MVKFISENWAIHPYFGWIFVPGLFCSGMGGTIVQEQDG